MGTIKSAICTRIANFKECLLFNDFWNRNSKRRFVVRSLKLYQNIRYVKPPTLRLNLEISKYYISDNVDIVLNNRLITKT